MLSNLKIVPLLLSASILSTQLSAQMTFSKVEIRNAYNKAEEGEKGRLVVDANSLRFVHKKNENMEYFSIPTEAVTEVFYSRVSGRRLKSAIGGAILFLPVALMAFSKGKKHYMTISFNDEKEIVGAVEFKLDKKNYRGVLRAVEEVADVELVFDQEGIKDEKESVATGNKAQSNQQIGTIEITSNPESAEIEIDGAYAGVTPRIKRLKPGEYKIKIKKKGYKSWERKLMLEADEQIPIRVELEKD